MSYEFLKNFLRKCSIVVKNEQLSMDNCIILKKSLFFPLL